MANTDKLNRKSTTDKALGLLVNGVELYSPTLFNDTFYYGEIVNINILNRGNNYDVITPPEITIKDPDGTGKDAKVIANMKGQLKEVVVVEPGVGYNKKPNLFLVGGNDKGLVKLNTNFTKKTLRYDFFPNSLGVGSTTITFNNKHKFKDGDEVSYDTNNYPELVGLDKNSYYYVGVVNSNTISLYESYKDSLSKANPVSGISVVVGVNTGVQYFNSSTPQNIIDKVYIENIDSELYNKKIKINSITYSSEKNINGISTESDFIFAHNHNFKEKDLIVYSTTNTPISGLSTTNYYYLTVLDDNKFKMSLAGVGNSLSDKNYNNKNYISLNSVGIGTHIFSYPPIEIKIEETLEIPENNSLKVKPIVLGEIESIFIEERGVGYGISEIVDLNRPPNVIVNEISNSIEDLNENATLQAVVKSGKIVDVLVQKSGANYSEDIDIIVGGEGNYAKLYPVIEQGKIIDVLILDSGIGYKQFNTNLLVKRRGSGAKLSADIKKWTVNQYFKNKNYLSSSYGNGYVIPSRTIKNSSQFINFYAPNELRESLNDENKKNSTIEKSPIVGWAYDGNPIFGPYLGEENNIKLFARSSYKLNIETNILKRPKKDYGYFVEDYVYDESKSDLDEHNGKFVNDRDEFPDGTYAYFCTVNSNKEPEYPYVIGPEFKNNPNLLNYEPSQNQNIDFTEKNYVKNTNPLYLTDQNSGYEYLKLLDEKYKQELIIKNVLSSGIDGFEIIESGQSYKVGDKIIFEVEDEQDITPTAEVSEIQGKNITNITVGITTLNNVSFKNLNNKIKVFYPDGPHNLKNNQYVYITSNINSNIDGMKKIEVKEKLSTLLSNCSSSGITTVITLNDISEFEVGDYIKIDSEIAKIVDIFKGQNKFLIHRLENVGLHTSEVSQVELLPSNFTYTNYTFERELSSNNLKYFNPINSVGLGTTGTLISNNITNKTYFVDSQRIYIENHKFKNNQKVIYNKPSTINGLRVSNTPTGTPYRLSNGQELYTVRFNKDFIGLTTVSYGATYLTFRESSYSDNEVHSLNFIQTSFTGKAEIFKLTLDTSINHLLQNNDLITIIGNDDTWEKYVCQFDLYSKYPVNILSSDSFSINLIKKPEFIDYSTYLDPDNIEYRSTSKNSKGGISNIKLSYTSSFYEKNPIVKEISSTEGSGAVILPYSNKIGRIDTVERIKDGFDYPSDITLQPKLSTNAVCYVDNINSLESVEILYGGKNYINPPTLKVLGNNDFSFTVKLKNNTVEKVTVNKTPNNLSNPLDIISINNSNGIDILDIYPLNSNTNRIEIDIAQFPLIYRDYLEPIVDFPFEVDDLIFIENCRIDTNEKNDYNSESNNYSYFKVVAVNAELGRIDYSTENIEDTEFGNYIIDDGYGMVVNQKFLPKFKMVLRKNNYINGEPVVALDDNNVVKFSGELHFNEGWDSERNQLRITKTFGRLETGDKIKGLTSRIEGKVFYLNQFTFGTSFGSSRAKNLIDETELNLGISSKKLQDGNYYQDFSYSIISEIPYSVWKESVKSIVHPSGFKEFSDLKIISEPINRLKASTSPTTLDLKLNIENSKTFYEKTNYTIAYESNDSNVNKTQRVFMGSGEQKWPIAGTLIPFKIQGISLLPYILNKTNSIIKLKPIDNQFTGTYESIEVSQKQITFSSSDRNNLGVSTTGLKVGDLIGYSSYFEYPYNTKIISIGQGKVGILYPHKVISGSKTETLEIRRNLNQNTIVGISSFKLVGTNNENVFKVAINSSNISQNGTITVQNKFENGQLIRYKNVGGNPIGIATTDKVIGGISTNILPDLIYVNKISDNKFKLSGTSELSLLEITSSGSGTHQFIFEKPNASTLITIDNIIQSPLYLRPLTLDLSASVGINSTVLYVSSGITSITSIDIIKIEDEYIKVDSVGNTSEDSIEITRGFLGSTIEDHSGILTAYVYRGNYLINEDIIYFTSPPFGPKGVEGLEINSKFTGRVFNRTFSADRPNDLNYVFDDISDSFVGLGTFKLKENENSIVGIYTNTNEPITLSNINNNPFVLINNIPQIVNSSFDIQNENENEIVFLDEYPNVGKIIKINTNQVFGYAPLVSAAATVSVSPTGAISQIFLNGYGSGYRIPPKISIVSSVGSGASISASIDSFGKVNNLTIVNSGVGYTSTEIPTVIIDEPLPYYNLSLKYSPSSIGIGTEAKVSLKIGNDSTIETIDIIDSGYNYKVGDILNVVGLVTDSSAGGSFVPLEIEVKEVVSDTFSGFYPGQFLQINDISGLFNNRRTSFDLFAVIEGETRRITFKSSKVSNPIENNLFIFINDVLQDPTTAYTYSNGRLIFTEPPKEESNCNILYYVGSYYDIEFVVPPQTIKEGDDIKFEDNELILEDIEQSSRTVKRLISSGSLDTFTYGGVGISNLVRPISWTKQRNDKIINGSLISKSRDIQRSRIFPTSKVIWNVNENDTSIYVDNAYPLFVELDDGVNGLIEGRRNVIIIDYSANEDASLIANVSGTSTVTSVSIASSGVGYPLNPVFSVSAPKNNTKDPLYLFTSISGLTTTYDLTSVVQGYNLTEDNISLNNGNIIAIGNSSTILKSEDLLDWNGESINNYIENIDLKRIGVSTQNTYVAVGSLGKIVMRDIESGWNICGIKTEILGIANIVVDIVDSSYSGTFNDVIYNHLKDTWIAVGDNGKIYTSIGAGNTTFIEKYSQNYNYKSVSYNSYASIAVGHSGASMSTDENVWYSISELDSIDCNCIIWDDSEFVITSNSGVYTLNASMDELTVKTNTQTNLNKITKYKNIYISNDDSGNVYTSLNLIDWLQREIPYSGQINEIKPIVQKSGDNLVLVGTSGTIFYSTPEIHKPDLSIEVVNGNIDSVEIQDGGFGYSDDYPPNIIVESPSVKYENILSIKAKGDYGKIVGIKTSNTGVGTNSPSISFELLTDYSSEGYDSLNLLGIEYSQLSAGDYFIIQNTNVSTAAGYALTGITTSLGGMSNYPNSKIGTATTYLDGVYKVDFVSSTNVPQGIVTVTCHVVPVNGGISLNTTGVTTNYYGNYSWSKIYDYNNREILTETPLSFEVNTDNGILGITTSPTIYRYPPLLF